MLADGASSGRTRSVQRFPGTFAPYVQFWVATVAARTEIADHHDMDGSMLHAHAQAFGHGAFRATSMRGTPRNVCGKSPMRGARGSSTIVPVGIRSRIQLVLACATIALGLFSVAIAPAFASAGELGHAQTAAKKKCKKSGKAAKKKRKKCKPRQKGNSQTPSVPTAPGPSQTGNPPNQEQVPDDACGPRIARSTGGNWDCTFSDDFDGTTLDLGSWIPQRTDTSGYVNGPTACFVDRPGNVSVSSGSLKLTARKEPAPFNCAGDFVTQYTSGMVSTAQGRFNQTYGRFEVRAKISSAQVKGLQTSLWLWPVDSGKYGSYPASGELDIAEMFSQYPDRAIPYVHYKPLLLTDPLATNTLCFISNPATFHTYTLEWTSSSIKISYDGKVCLLDYWVPAQPQARPQPFDQPFFILLTQALGVGTNEFDPATTPLPATTAVDYVRAWE
jgi:beta-glucanase (GH16 family)